MDEKREWIKTNNLEPDETRDCTFGFIQWVCGQVELVGVNDGISWDEASYFMPLYDLALPDKAINANT